MEAGTAEPLEDSTMNPTRCHIWSGGQLFAFSGVDGATDFAEGLTLRSAFTAAALDVLLPERATLTFADAPPTSAEFGGDFFRLELADATVVTAAFPDAWHLLIDGPATLGETLPPALRAERQGNRLLLGAASHFNPEWLTADLDRLVADRARWLDSQPLPPGVAADASAATALRKAYSLMKTQVYAPEPPIPCRWSTPDRYPHRCLWLWDSAFHAIGWRHLDPALARELLAAVFAGQREDGMIPHMLRPDWLSAFTQPPVLALGASLLMETQPDTNWLADLYPRLRRYLEWDLRNRDSDGAGLAEWSIEESIHCRSGESGMDNSSRFDTATPLDATDFNSFLARECELMAAFAVRLGILEDVGLWKERRDQLCRLINERLWNEKIGLYVDYDLRHQRQSPVLASAGFLPLLCGAPTPAQAERLAAHLRNPQTFGTAFPVPSIAESETHYAKDMWRGPTWINLNWLIAQGLDRYGHHELATDLRQRTCREIERWFQKYGTFFEYYDDRGEVPPPKLLRKGKCAPEQSPYHQVMFDFGWTATLYTDLCWTAATGH